MSHPFVTVIVPTRDEERYIAATLDSILATAYPADRLEVLVVDGQSRDRTPAVVREYAVRHPAVALLDNPKRTAPAALNVGIRAARGEVIVRMDAHVVYPTDYLPRAVAALAETGADNVGGVIVTRPGAETPMGRAIALGLSHRLGVGNSYFRIGTAERRWVDTVPFGCFRRSLFDRIGMFDEDLVRNQDDEFNFRIRRQGGRVLLLPDLVAYYYARPALRQVARMYFQYGYFKPLVARKLGRIMTVRQLVPAAFLLTLATAALLAPWFRWAALGGAAVAAAYALAVGACAAAAATRHGVRCGLALATVFPVLHASYGFGFLRGIVDHVLRRGRVAPDPAALAPSR
ncbi:MAG TPA: glycosyltransferase family 2 protein [Gemmatimonadales bacterium]|jgi:glycosyltransferase involved in cell wall biosynthesis|nr:glycosyltransferase family 2 protein [Gemmatimonadales bacterium]